MGQPKKILFVITKSVWGGAQKYVYDLAINLPEEFLPVVALGGNGPLAEKLREAGIKIYTIQNFQKAIHPFKDIFAFFELLRLIRNLRPAIIHANSSKAGGIAAAAARMAHIPGTPRAAVIFTVHGWGFHESLSVWQLWLRRIASRLTASLTDKIITVSQYDYMAAHKRHIAPPRKLVTIPVGVSDILFRSREDAQQFLFGESGLTPTVGVIAEWTRNKGLDVFIRAWAHVIKNVPQAQACLVGWGEEERQLKKLAADLGLATSITFKTGVLDAATYLKALDVFVLSSRKEGLPYSILEAGKAGVAVVATWVGGVPEIIQSGETGLLVPPNDSVELARGIETLLINPQKRLVFGSELAKHITARFSERAMLERTYRLYHTCLQRLLPR